MTELADRLSRHADLHEHQPWADDEQMQFARDLREAVGLIAELARLRAQVPVGWIGPSGFTHNTATNRMWMRESPKLAAKLSPVYAAPPAQPAEQQAQTVCKRTLVEIDARLRECSIVGASAADAYDTFYQHMVETALAAQPAEPVQRLSDAGIEALAGKHGTTYRNRHFPTQPAFSFSNGSLHRFVRDIESAIQPQPGWRDIESAPRDGSKILLAKYGWSNDAGDAVQGSDEWKRRILDQTRRKYGLWWCVAGHWSARWNNWNDGVEPSGLAGPTHWMPLPPAPKATK